MPTIAIVGAGPQLGLAIGRRFAREGHGVALLARREAQLQAMVDELEASGATARAFPADIRDRPALRAALAAAEEHFGSIDVLEFSPAPTIPDLAAHPLVPAVDLTVEAIIPEMEFYLFGGVTAVQQVLPGMLERGSGTVIATSGAGSGPMTVPFVSSVNVANAGLRNWILALHESVADRGIHVAHLALGAAIGNGRPKSHPDVIADAYWRLHAERSVSELFYDDMDGVEIRLADKFVDEPGV
jgi:NAD(P)-dependent dehydrogenase (short-subunit alcohol dehydrogenase family)